jgi:hemoglobin
MVDFWCSVILASGDFKDKVCGTHMQLQGIEADHFRRWLSLFETHVQRLFYVEVAEETGLSPPACHMDYFGRADVV